MTEENRIPRAEVIAVGDELIAGQRLDTNSQWLSQKLSELGFRVVRHATVGDDLQEHAALLREAVTRSDLVISTGGLGPTADDLTRQAIAAAFQRPLRLDEPSLRAIESLFARRGREMAPSNRVQAMLPEGSRAIANPHGSAPGIYLCTELDGKEKHVIALPGVPAEMREMWDESVQAIARGLLPQTLHRYFHVVKLFGIGESDCQARIPDLLQRGRVPMVGITVSRATISLRISAWAENEDEFRRMIQPTLEIIEHRLGDLVFGHGETELEDCVAQLLAGSGQKLAVVEFGAATWLSGWLLQAEDRLRTGLGADISIFAGGLALPTVDAALGWVDIPSSDTGDSCRGRDKGRLASFAARAASQTHADLVLVIDSYPSTSQIIEATAPIDVDFLVWSTGGAVHARKSLGGHPDVLGPRIAKTGLDLVRRKLLAQKPKAE